MVVNKCSPKEGISHMKYKEESNELEYFMGLIISIPEMMYKHCCAEKRTGREESYKNMPTNNLFPCYVFHHFCNREY